MDFDFSEDQQMLAQTVADFAKKESPVERFRKLRDDEIGWEPKVWKHMGELGWLSVPFPESVGGYGGTFVDAALILEQFGKALIPEPYLPSVILGGLAVLRAGDADQQQRLLAPMIQGDASLALAYAERENRHDPSAIETEAKTSGTGYALSGEKVWVLNGHRADHLIVSAQAPGGPTLFAVPRDAQGLSVTRVGTIEGKKAAFVKLDGVKVGDEDRLGEEGSAGPVLDRVMDYGAAAAVAEGAGIAQTMLEMTVEYLGTREQFGVKIGTFQALQHRAVDMFVETELLRSISLASMAKVDEDDEAERRAAVSAAKYQLATGGVWVAQQALQLHGGIGVTDEHDIGLYFKRMYALNALFGDEEHHVQRFAKDPRFAEAAD
ncbi:MAG: acyl-CoA dehydrogenase family protein [Myxococcota bacterium]